jgi:hypothetical protein
MTRRRIFLATIGVAVLALAVAGAAQTVGQPIKMSAWAVSMGTVRTGANGVIMIKIDKWSTNTERQTLLKAFQDKGQDGLLNALQKTPVKGRIWAPSYPGPDNRNIRLGWDLHYAVTMPGEDGGQKILVMTDRYISFLEARDQPRTIDYPFTLLEIHLNKDGEGEGKMAVALKITANEKNKTVELENYSSEPVRLQQIKVEK